MWPFDRSSARSYVRIGRHAVERWQGSSAGLSLRAEHRFEQGRLPTIAELEDALRELFGSGGTAATVLVESAWAPIVLVDTGDGFLRQAQLAELARHRVRLTYDRIDDPVAAWSIRVDHRAGDRHAMAFALSPHVCNAVLAAASASNIKLSGINPAFDWGWQSLKPAKRLLRRGGWWAWPEQDRMLLARVSEGRVIGLHPAVEVTLDARQIVRDVEAEAIRQGVAGADERVVLARWGTATPTGSADGPVSWVDLGARAEAGTAPEGKALAGAVG